MSKSTYCWRFSTNGAAKGACILHEAVIELNINSHLLNNLLQNFTLLKMQAQLMKLL